MLTSSIHNTNLVHDMNALLFCRMINLEISETILSTNLDDQEIETQYLFIVCFFVAVALGVGTYFQFLGFGIICL